MESNPVGSLPYISSVPAIMSLHYDYSGGTLANINPFLPKLLLVMITTTMKSNLMKSYPAGEMAQLLKARHTTKDINADGLIQPLYFENLS